MFDLLVLNAKFIVGRGEPDIAWHYRRLDRGDFDAWRNVQARTVIDAAGNFVRRV